ncbi:MAG TPA: DinB family protein [Candidatus Acidoferrum sp.]|nr:DinB family protein [Candidatus Acidoferrum sp.]
MISMTPEQAAFLLQYNLPAVKNEHRTTSGIIAAIPTSNADYRPDPQSKTAAELAWHIVAAEHRFYGGIVSGAFDFNNIPRPEGGITPENIVKFYAESFAKNFDNLTRLTPEQALKPIDFRGMFQLPAVAFLDLAMKHSVHHRGQLSTYLRAMGGKVPAIYGESYDSAEAKKSAAAS